jgi:hypothetical protein
MSYASFQKKTIEQIKAENLQKLKAVTANLKMKKTVVIDKVDDGETNDAYRIDPAWDSTEGLDIKKLVA